MKEWVVLKEEAGLKLITFLKQKLEKYSARHLKRALEENLCNVNGITERFASKTVGEGDRVSLKIENYIDKKNPKDRLEPQKILYQDDYILIYDKPAGISSDSFNTEYHLVHRLDKETTGALIFAKSEAVFKEMVQLFRKQLVEKVYLAIVDGVPKHAKGIVDNYLEKKRVYEGQTMWGASGKQEGLHALTLWNLERKGKDAALLRCFPKTGRTHQIRVHLSEMGHPILGDYQYCRHFNCRYQPRRYLLHAYEVSFKHPITDKQIKVLAPLPEDFLEAEKALFEL